MGPVAIGSLAQWRMIPNEWTYDVASDVPWDFGFGSFIVGVQFTCANLNLP
jgi:hypothetical protein